MKTTSTNGYLSRCQWLIFLALLCLVHPADAEQPHATDSVLATHRRDSCSTDTGATCPLGTCDASRNAVCESRKCVCSSGKCVVDGACVSTGARQLLASTAAATPTAAPTCNQNTGTACVAGICFAAGQHCVGNSWTAAGSCYCTDACFENGACTRTPAHDCSQVTGGTCLLYACDASRNAVCEWPNCVCTGLDQCAMDGACSKPATDQCVDKGGKVTASATFDYTNAWKDATGQHCSFYGSSLNISETTAIDVSRLALLILDIMVNNYIYTQVDTLKKFTSAGALVAFLLSQLRNNCPRERTNATIGDFNMTANEACCACGGGNYSSQDTAVQASLMSIYDATDGPGWVENYGWGAVGVHYCRWSHLRCDSHSNVISMFFVLEDLHGKLPDQFNALSTLQVFNYGLSFNGSRSLAGTIPASFTALTSLKSLMFLPHFELDFKLLLEDFSLFIASFLSTNSYQGTLRFAPSNLSGTIPQLNSGIMNILIANTELSGSIPSSIEVRPNVRALVILCILPQYFMNSIIGKQADPPFREIATCSKNPISGTLSKALVQSSEIQVIYVWPSRLSGTLPKFTYSPLENFGIRGNSGVKGDKHHGISGTVPDLRAVFNRTSQYLELATLVGTPYSFILDSTQVSGTLSAALYDTSLSQVVLPSKWALSARCAALSQSVWQAIVCLGAFRSLRRTGHP